MHNNSGERPYLAFDLVKKKEKHIPLVLVKEIPNVSWEKLGQRTPGIVVFSYYDESELLTPIYKYCKTKKYKFASLFIPDSTQESAIEYLQLFKRIGCLGIIFIFTGPEEATVVTDSSGNPVSFKALMNEVKHKNWIKEYNSNLIDECVSNRTKYPV